MSTSANELVTPLAEDVKVTRDELNVQLSDGRAISVPLAWYPRLLHASAAERQDWRFIGKGRGIHWDAVDEDISVQGLLLGHRSSESQDSLARWLASRPTGRRTKNGGASR